MLSLVFPGVITIMFLNVFAQQGRNRSCLAYKILWCAVFSMLFTLDCTEKGGNRSCLAYKFVWCYLFNAFQIGLHREGRTQELLSLQMIVVLPLSMHIKFACTGPGGSRSRLA